MAISEPGAVPMTSGLACSCGWQGHSGEMTDWRCPTCGEDFSVAPPQTLREAMVVTIAELQQAANDLDAKAVGKGALESLVLRAQVHTTRQCIAVLERVVAAYKT